MKGNLEKRFCSCRRQQRRHNQTINNGAPNFDAQIRLLDIGHKSPWSSTQRQVWSSSCVGHLFPPIRFHFCCPAKLWNNRIGKWTCCCTTETFLSASLWVPVAFPSCLHVCWHTSLCWSVLVVLWYTNTEGLMMCACAQVSTTSSVLVQDLFVINWSVLIFIEHNSNVSNLKEHFCLFPWVWWQTYGLLIYIYTVCTISMKERDSMFYLNILKRLLPLPVIIIMSCVQAFTRQSQEDIEIQDVCMCASSSHLGIVTHFVLLFCVLMAFSSSSSCPVFFSFFTKLFTAFSHHFSSCPPPFCSPTPPIPPPAPPLPAGVFFQPSSRFTTGGVKGRMEDMVACLCIRGLVCPKCVLMPLWRKKKGGRGERGWCGWRVVWILIGDFEKLYAGNHVYFV